MRKIIATFKGTNGSLGYTTGEVYVLQFREYVNEGIQIRRVAGGGVCEYKNTLSFFNNWTDIKTDII